MACLLPDLFSGFTWDIVLLHETGYCRALQAIWPRCLRTGCCGGADLAVPEPDLGSARLVERAAAAVPLAADEVPESIPGRWIRLVHVEERGGEVIGEAGGCGSGEVSPGAPEGEELSL